MPHPVHILPAINALADALRNYISAYTQIAVLVDENTQQHCYPLLREHLPAHHLIQIKSGEEQKHLGTCQHIWQCLTDWGFDRKGLLINLGGGVIGDMGGFCAATYKRGIAFLQLPTTLLAQVDASVGGKLGIDFMGYKNHIGVFQDPLAVLVYPAFINTLSDRELRSGFAEIIKHCLIRDKNKWLEIAHRPLKDQHFSDLIAHSIDIKKAVVEEDPTEKGLRKILNFGHTIGHAIETHFLGKENRLLHGEAIAVGMIAENYLAAKRGWISIDECESIAQHIMRLFGKVALSEDDIAQSLPHALQDKKNEKGAIQASLLGAVGNCGYNHAIALSEIEEALQWYAALPSA
jgi:3-dehydroquinate synthase